MKQIINENNTTMTKTLNENINEPFKEFQNTLMKTVEEMIAKQMSIINLNIIQTIQGTLTNQTHQARNQEVTQRSTYIISQSSITQPLTIEPEINDKSISNDLLSQVGIMKKTMVNAKQKQDDQLVPDQTQDTTTEDPNDIIMEDQTPTTLPNQRTQTRFSSPNRRETRKKGPLVLPKTLSRLGKTTE